MKQEVPTTLAIQDKSIKISKDIILDEYNKEENSSSIYDVTIIGTIFHRSIRAAYASLDILLNHNNEHVVVLIQLSKNKSSSSSSHPVTSQRSHIRRICKLGNEVQISKGRWKSSSANNNKYIVSDVNNEMNRCKARRFELDEYSNDDDNDDEGKIGIDKRIQVLHILKWDMLLVQKKRTLFYPQIISKNNKASPLSKESINDKRSAVITTNRKLLQDEQTTTISCSKDKSNNENIKSNHTNNNISMSKLKSRNYPGKTGHGGGVGKFVQGEIVAEFLIEQIMNLLLLNMENITTTVESIEKTTPTTVTVSSHRDDLRIRAIQYLSSGTGVIDAAGGSGHVSLALAIRGIKSTVVDPRENVGKLPSRDRKLFRKLRKRFNSAISDEKTKAAFESKDSIKCLEDPMVKDNSSNELLSSRIVEPIEFATLRAWFSNKPKGVDVQFREGQNLASENVKNIPYMSEVDDRATDYNSSVPICSMCSPDRLLPNCSAIIALHPDEATGSIVEFAVKHRIPFVVIPCCVFSRLFPMRFKPLPNSTNNVIKNEVSKTNTRDAVFEGSYATGIDVSTSPKDDRKINMEVVSTYNDLIDYLVDKDSSIKVTPLNFDGANLAVWSVFSNKQEL